MFVSGLVTCCKCKCNSNRADCGINLLSEVETRKSDQSDSQPNVRCSCGEHNTTSLCKECDEQLCDLCVNAHRRVRLTKDHTIIQLQPISSRNRYVCQKHPAERLELFCEKCNKVTCRTCHQRTGGHADHPYTDVSQAAVSFRKDLNINLSELKEKVALLKLATPIIVWYHNS